MPFYLHPRDQLPSRRQAYEGHPWLVGSPWGFADETAIHALRLMGCGLFDEFPKLQIVLGHLGERIPYDLWRLDHRLNKVPNRPAKRTMGEYFRNNFHITTSGHFCTPSLIRGHPDRRRRPRAVRGRLSVRGSHARLRVVRCRRDRRSRSRENRPHQCDGVVCSRLIEQFCQFVHSSVLEPPSCSRVMCSANTIRVQGEHTMLRTMFAMTVAGLLFAAVSGTSQAAPIAPLPSGRD